MIDSQELELYNKYKMLIGTDEVGLGSLASVVVACAVVVRDLEALSELLLKPKRKVYEVGDSKSIPSYVREELVSTIKKVIDKSAYGIVLAEEINQIKNIYKCGFIARYRAIQRLNMKEGVICIDGPFGCVGIDLPSVGIVGGDKRFKSIGAASILAKVFRDEWMKELHRDYPYYDWYLNVGYKSKKHFLGLKERGVSDLHRYHVGGVDKYFRQCLDCGFKSVVFDREGGKKCLGCGKAL